MTKGPRRHTNQARRRETPSRQAIPPSPKGAKALDCRRPIYHVSILLNRLGKNCFFLISWPWRHPWTVTRALGRGTRHVWGFSFRIATLLSVSYLVYDRIYEADATISASASDPRAALMFPFTITNNSHIFVIRDVRWNCKYILLVSGIPGFEGARFENTAAINGTRAAIEAGRSFNFDCNLLGPKTSPITTAVLDVGLTYRSDFFGWFSLVRHPSPTRFTWVSSASNPQWIKGDFAK